MGKNNSLLLGGKNEGVAFAIAIVLTIKLLAILNLSNPTSVAVIEVSGNKIGNTTAFTKIVTNSERWFNSYGSGHYSLILQTSKKNYSVSSIQIPNTFIFYLDENLTQCGTVYLHDDLWGIVVDQKQVCERD